jgi:hypothetical protein
MTPFQQAVQQVREGNLQAPSVSMGSKTLDYFAYQINVHHFNMKLMAKGMKFRGITFTQLKNYYGLKGRSAKDCLAQFEQILADFKEGKI